MNLIALFLSVIIGYDVESFILINTTDFKDKDRSKIVARGEKAVPLLSICPDEDRKILAIICDIYDKRCGECIVRLGSAKFVEREQAGDELVRIGVFALDKLVALKISTKDPDVYYRVTRIINDIYKAPELVGMPSELVPEKFKFRP